MATAYQYRLKFVDIRVNKPAAEEEPRRPEDRACEHEGCARAGAHKAPKGRDQEGQYWWFCAEHAGEYNRGFNYFAGMSDAELMAYAARESVGHRPTWTFKASSRDRLSAAMRRSGRRRDPFELFGEDGDPRVEPRRPRPGRLQAMALDVLGLEEAAEPAAVRARYAELVKRLHPDSNGGDRSTEGQLQKVIRAFQTLKAAGFA